MPIMLQCFCYSTSPDEQPFSGCNEKFGTEQEKKEQTTSNQNVQYHVQTCDMCDKVNAAMFSALNSKNVSFKTISILFNINLIQF